MELKMSSPSTYSTPCAACKYVRRKCMHACIFAPYFPPEEPQKFIYVHKIFGAGNVAKLLRELPPHQREDAVNSLAYEAEARVRDPVYGCAGTISFLQRQVEKLQKDLDTANADLVRYSCNNVEFEFPLPWAQLETNRITPSPGFYATSSSSNPLPYLSLAWSNHCAEFGEAGEKSL